MHIPCKTDSPEWSKTRIPSEFTGAIRSIRKIKEITIVPTIVYIRKKTHQSRLIIRTRWLGIILECSSCSDKIHRFAHESCRSIPISFRHGSHHIGSDTAIQYTFTDIFKIRQSHLTIEPVSLAIFNIITTLILCCIFHLRSYIIEFR